ncbi:MAG: hypothetical protein NC548_24785 [Lachnospiraceae bacterium]|nr:hypothetical protein [Lachnospiraceae bacterium]
MEIKNVTLQSYKEPNVQIYPQTSIAQVNDLQDTLDTLATTESVDGKLDALKTEILGEGNLVEAFDTLKEVSDWVASHSESEYPTIFGDVNTLKTVVDGLGESKLDKSVYEAKIAELTTTINTLTEKLTALENATVKFESPEA